MFKKTADTIYKILRTLKDTPFDEKRSMFEVTTVMVTSEFGRTMRIDNSPISETGTNHNPLNNSVLLAGKGIKGGLVIGASDLEDENASASGAHLTVDKSLEKLMGRPFDFKTQTSRLDRPSTFDIKDYLTINSVVNTIYTLFDVPPNLHRAVDRMGPPALTLPSILR